MAVLDDVTRQAERIAREARTALETDPLDVAEARCALSRILEAAQAIARAAASAEPPTPTSALDHEARGVALASAQRLDEAEVALREAVRLDAGRPSALSALARVLLDNPRFQRSGTLPVASPIVH